MIGLARRAKSVPCSSSSQPPDPIVMEQLQERDNRIAALEEKMEEQQRGYEEQKRLNERMMEMMRKMYPNEQFP